MGRMGNLFRRNYGGTRFRKATSTEKKKVNEDETFTQATHRIAFSYYGQSYNSLNPSQKKYVRDKAKRFRSNVYIQD